MTDTLIACYKVLIAKAKAKGIKVDRKSVV